MEYKNNESNLKEYATYADGIGPWYKQLISGKDDKGNWKSSNLVTEAHQLGLVVHAYTFRADDLGEFSSLEELLDVGFNTLQLDGVFTDFPDRVVRFLNKSK
jgi:glycerophosphoryl diester phosphodiesterase